MFGLMRAKKCGTSDAEKYFRRLNYCGTCKTTGALYSQKSRLLLNHDTVFLAEILTALGNENVNNWQKSYQSFNCLNLPANEMPLSLQFAATTNVILTEFKLADHFADEGKRRYEFVRKAFSAEFKKAESLLQTWNFPLAEVKTILQSQSARESEVSGNSANEILENLAAPTARTTAIFFAEGVKLIGKNDLANTAHELGLAFGKLIYLLDAFEDYVKDFSKNQFNAIRAAFDLEGNKISAEAKRKTVSILRGLENEIVGKIHALPLAENKKNLFAARLANNLQRKLKTNLPVVSRKTSCVPKPKLTFAQRWQVASEKAKTMARGFSWQMPLVFLFVFAFALVAPAQTREAKSARECFDLSFNLMFLSAIFGSVIVSAKTLWLENPEELLTKAGRKKKARQAAGEDDEGAGWCDTCECCCCGCDGCGDNCDCCSGCCDGCDCCGSD